MTEQANDTTPTSGPEGDRFTRLKLEWVQRVICDPTVGPMAARLGAYLALVHLSRVLRYAFPSQETIAAALGVTEQYVWKLTNQLKAHGYLIVQAPRGRGYANRYFLALPDSAGRAVHVFGDGKKANSGRENPNFRAEKTQTGVCPNPLSEPSDSKPIEASAASPSATRYDKQPLQDGFPNRQALEAAKAAASKAGVELNLEFEAAQFRGWFEAMGARSLDQQVSWRNWIAKSIRIALGEDPEDVFRRRA